MQVAAAENFREAVQQRLNDSRTEANQVLTSVVELGDGTHTLFGWGDDYKIFDCLNGRVDIIDMSYVSGSMRYVRGAVVLPSGENCIVENS